MSQARRYKVRAILRWHRRVARFITEVCKATRSGRHGFHQPAWDGSGDSPARQPYVERFDVEAVRVAALKAVGSYPSGNARARLGFRVLAAIRGQPSECSTCGGGGYIRDYSGRGTMDPPARIHCKYCQGTGHNLRGLLPPVEWSTALIRWAKDGEDAAWAEGTGDPREGGEFAIADPVQVRILADAAESGWLLTPDQKTRVTGRREHRRWGHKDGWRGMTLDQRINAKYWNSIDNPGKPVQPRWHLGERRQRARSRGWPGAVGESSAGDAG